MEIEITDHYGKPILRKLFLYFMRTIIFLLCTTVLGFTAETTFSQEKVTVDSDKVLSVDEVFDLIKTQTKYRFIYPQDLFEDAPKVNLNKGRFSVELLLQKAVKKEDFNIILGKNNRIMIKPKALSVQRQVTGSVTDNNGAPLPGVTVRLKGTTRGTMTDYDGKYRILVADSEQVLVFSYVGFKSQEIVVGSRNVMDIAMEEEVSALDEVVVNAGYYTTSERVSTGNIARITGEEIEMQPVSSPIEALQGRMAGVSIVQRSGIPGTASQIQIRGQNSLRNQFENNGNLPLYIIDGLPVDSNPINSFSGLTTSTTQGLDPLSTLNLSNIESIEVLKDADATAIYGSRGANGVILITTKGGGNFEQKTKVDVNLYSGISEVGHFVDMLKTQDYLMLREEAFAYDDVEQTVFNARDLLQWDRNRYTDWQDALFGGTAETTNANVSISGGNQSTSFRLSGGLFNTGTVFPGDFGYKKWSTGLSLNHRNNDGRFNARLSINYGIDQNNQFNGNTFFSNGLNLPPNAPALYNEDGSLNWENSTWTNPLAVTLRDSNAMTQQLIASLGLSYKVVKGLVFKTNVGYNMLDSDELVNNPVTSYDPSVRDRAPARSNHSQSYRSSWIFEPQLDYGFSVGDWRLDALIGATFQQRRSKNFRGTAVGYANEELVGNLAAADNLYISDNREIMYKYNAVYARVGLNIKDRYLINLTGRRDGSSRFGPENRFENFGAIGTAWIFSEENFAKHVPWLSFGKLRGSFGTTGNDQIQDYGYLDTYSSTPAPGGLYPTQLVNPDYSWETNKKLEAAMELGFFDDRLRFQLSWYRNRSSNQLVGFNLPRITGFTSVQANFPATVENSGWEIEGTSINLSTEHWQWQTNFNLSLPKNRLVSFPDIEESPYARIYSVGDPLSIRFLYQFNGLNPETGLYEVEDVNQDGSYDFEDQIVVKNTGRQFFGGIRNQLSFKNLSFSFLLEFVGQESSRTSTGVPGRFRNVPQYEFDNRWLEPGDADATQRASYSTEASRAYNRAMTSEWGFVNTSFVRLKTMELGYRIPLETKVFSSSRVFLQGQNLFTWTNFEGLDAQNPGSSTLPALRTISLGLEINF